METDHQEPLTVVANVRRDRLTELKALVERMHADPKHNDVIPLGKLPRSHFARLFVLDPAGDPSGPPIEPSLVLMSDCDGSADSHLKALLQISGDGIDTLFQNCADYPPPPATPEQRLDYLRERIAPTATFYANRVGHTVEQIRGEAELCEAIRRFIDRSELEGLSATHIRNKIRAFVGQTPELGWALEAPAPLAATIRAREQLHRWGAPALALALWPLAAAALIAVRVREATEPAPSRQRASQAHVEALASVVDFSAQNPFAVLGFVKPGRLRRTVLEAVLRVANYGTRHIYNRGNLGGIPSLRLKRSPRPPFIRPRLHFSGGVKTIHFARWVPLNDYRRVLFVSNYDGNLESYMNDFIDKVAWGLNLVFSNGVGYPKTRWLIKGGASDEQLFKAVNVRQQIPTRVWHSAYPELTTLHIDKNSQVRAGLRGQLNERQAREWLALF